MIFYVYEDFDLDVVRGVLVDKSIEVRPLSKRSLVAKTGIILKNGDTELIITPGDVNENLVNSYGDDNRFASWDGNVETLRELLSNTLQLELTSVEKEELVDEAPKVDQIEVKQGVEEEVQEVEELQEKRENKEKEEIVVEVYDSNNLLQGIDLRDESIEEPSILIDVEDSLENTDSVVNVNEDELQKIKNNFELQMRYKDQLYSKFVSPERYIEVKNRLQQALTTIGNLRDDLAESQTNIVEVEARQQELQNKVDVLTADIEVYENVGGNFTAQDNLLQLDDDLIHNLKSKVTFHVLGDSLSFDYFYSKYNFENLFVEFTTEAYSDMYLDHYVNLKDTTEFLGGNVSLSSVISNAIYEQNTVYVVSGLASIVDYGRLTLGSLKHVLNSLVLSSYNRIDVYLGTLSSSNKFIDLVLANRLDLQVWTSVNSSELSMRFALLNILGRSGNLDEATKNITLVADCVDFINNEQFKKFKTKYLEGSVV